MAVILIRTVFFFVLLIIVMRMTGKRQIGEMQISEFVTAFLISETAALPITDIDIPVLHGITAICVLGSLETLTTFAAKKWVPLRRMLTGEPVILVSNGKVIEKALTRTRITLDDIFAEIRIAGYRNIGDIQYVILEQNGKMSVLPKAAFDRLTPSDMGINVKDNGITHPVIIDGKICKTFAEAANCAPKEQDDILYMTCDNSKNKVRVLKEKTK